MEIQHPIINRSIENAQTRVEGRNFDIRKHLLEYDNVMNKQREVIYAERRKVLEGEDLKEHYLGMIEETLDQMTAGYSPDNEETFAALSEMVRKVFPIQLDDLQGQPLDAMADALIERAKTAYEVKEKELTPDFMRHLERMILLDVVDSKWKEHLRTIDNLQEGIGLRAYGQKDPLVEYKRETFEAFQEMVDTIKRDSLSFVFRVQPMAIEKKPEIAAEKPSAPMQFIHPEAKSGFAAPPASMSRGISPGGEGVMAPVDFPPEEEPAAAPVRNAEAKVGRNDPCPCGSGKKYKKCHGA